MPLPILLPLMLACAPDDPEPAGPPAPPVTTPTTPSTPTTGPTDTSTAPEPTADTGLEVTGLPTGYLATGSTGATAGTGDTGGLGTIDCAVAVPSVTSSRLLPGGRGYHGLAFNDLGELVGSDGSSLIAVDSAGVWRILLPGTGSLQQIDSLSDGTLIVGSSTDGQVFSVASNGAVTPLASISSIYGIRVGPDDKVYVANQQAIYRVDPSTGQVETWLDSPVVTTPKVFEFSHDLTQVYIGTNGQNGQVYRMDVDANFDPVSAPVLFATTPGSWHDGLRVDICGNVYVAEYFTSGMYVITPSGNVSTLFIAQGGGGPDYYAHGIIFGTGRDGWPADAIYVPQPYNGNTVSELVIGMPYRTWGGTVLNQP